MMDILGVSGNQCTQPWRMFFLGTMIGFTGSCWSPGAGRNFRGAGWSDGLHAPVTSYQRGDNHWRYVTIENSFTCGIGPGMGAVVEHSRIENLYDGADSSGIQMPSIQNQFSTLRYNWIINAPGLEWSAI